jgi:hypothetical protein
MEDKSKKSPFQIRSTGKIREEAKHPANTSQPNMRFTEAEMLQLKGMFGGEDLTNIKLLRKLFLPSYEADAPLQQNIDLWMTINLNDMTPEEALVRIYARNEVISHVEQRLNQIQILANATVETPEERDARLAKDSNQ